jgi:hypothetical protein
MAWIGKVAGQGIQQTVPEMGDSLGSGCIQRGGQAGTSAAQRLSTSSRYRVRRRSQRCMTLAASGEVTLLDYGAGNVRSVRNAVKKLGFTLKEVGARGLVRSKFVNTLGDQHLLAKGVSAWMLAGILHRVTIQPLTVKTYSSATGGPTTVSTSRTPLASRFPPWC